MNLKYAVHEIAGWLDATVKGDSGLIVKNICIDSRSPLINEQTLFVALSGNKANGHDYCAAFATKGGQIALVEKEINNLNITQIIVKDTLKSLQIIAKNHRKKFNIPVIGITGSNGKTTVKEWLYHTLKTDFNIVRSPKSYNSQLGVPLSVLEMSEHHTLAIFEAGISEPDEMETLEHIISPTIGIFTGLGDAHQVNFSSLEEKKNEKFKLFRNVNTLIETEKIDPTVIESIPFKDSAAQLNATLVYQTAEYLGLDSKHILSQLQTLPKISMRMERMEGNNGNIIINDAYTFDEKGLEIGLQNLSLNANRKSKVLILAPDENYKVNNDLVRLIDQADINTLVWIHPNPIELKIPIHHFRTVAQYIKNPVQFENSVILFSGSRTSKLESTIPLYQQKKHITKLEINLSAIRTNINHFRQILKLDTMILAMVKAQSYGSGIVEMASFLQQEKINYLGVAYTDEGKELREQGIQLPILVMNPEQNAFDDLIDYNLEPSIYSFEILNQFLHQLILKGKKRFPVHIKIDTGMHRLGFQGDEIKELTETINAQPEIYVKSVFSHFAAADDKKERDFTVGQYNSFNAIATTIAKNIGYDFIKHICNSDGALNYPEAHFDMIRLGVGLFGLTQTKRGNLDTALSFKTQISQTKLIPPGETVGYGRRHICTDQTEIAIIPVGYADGLSRGLGNKKWSVKVNDKFTPIIGSVCMDMSMIDITGLNCKVGDEVEIFGWENSIADMADIMHTIPYEIISTISSRVHRVYID